MQPAVGRGEQHAVRAEADPAHRARQHARGAERLAAPPDLHGAVRAAGGDVLAARRERDARERTVRREHPLRAAGQRREAQRLTVADRELGARGRERERGAAGAQRSLERDRAVGCVPDADRGARRARDEASVRAQSDRDDRRVAGPGRTRESGVARRPRGEVREPHDAVVAAARDDPERGV